MWATWVPLGVAGLALLGSIYSANVSHGKLDKSESIELEGRLKDIESGIKLMQQDITAIKDTMITPDQRATLLLVDERVNTILAGLGTFVPNALRNPEHLDHILDELSQKASTEGWTSVIEYLRYELAEEKREELLAYIEKVSGDGRYKTEKRHGATLYLSLLRLELGPLAVK